MLLHRDRLSQVTRLVYVGAFDQCHMVGQQLQRNRVDNRCDAVLHRRHMQRGGVHVISNTAVLVSENQQFSTARADFLKIGFEFFDQRVVGCDGNHRHVGVNQGQRAVFQFTGGVGLGVYVGDLLEFECAFQRNRKLIAATQKQRVLPCRRIVGQFF